MQQNKLNKAINKAIKKRHTVNVTISNFPDDKVKYNCIIVEPIFTAFDKTLTLFNVYNYEVTNINYYDVVHVEKYKMEVIN